MKEKSIKLNALLSTIRTVLNILFPLITFPYATRVLQTENLGKLNYAGSVESYFALIAALGISTYAVREGAKIREKKDEFSKFSSEILTTNLITALVAYFLLAITLLVVRKFDDYRFLIISYSLSIFFSTIGVEWINTIYEDYGYILVRGIIIQILTVVCMFLFVKKPSDLYIYAWISIINGALVSVLNLIHVRKYCKLRLTKKPNLIKHLKPALVFFAASVSISIYLNSDVTMLGLIVGDYYTGLYSVAVKIYTLVKTVLNSIYTVSIPRLSLCAEKEDWAQYRSILSGLCGWLIILIFPCIAFLFGLSKNIVLIVSGEGYLGASVTLKILAFTLLAAVGAGITVTCLNVTLRKEKISLYATAGAAVLNILLNLFMIPWLKQNGAAITTFLSELFVAVFCLINTKNLRKHFDLSQLGRTTILAVSGSVGIGLLCFLANWLIPNIWVACIVAGITGAALYFGIILGFKDQYALEIVNAVKNKLFHKK